MFGCCVRRLMIVICLGMVLTCCRSLADRILVKSLQSCVDDGRSSALRQNWKPKIIQVVSWAGVDTVFDCRDAIGALLKGKQKGKVNGRVLWVCNGRAIRLNRRDVVTSDGGRRLKLLRTSSDDNGVWECRLTVSCTTVTAKIWTATVHSPEATVRTSLGMSLNLTCHEHFLKRFLDGLRYEWYYNGTPYRQPDVDYLPTLTEKHRGVWECRVVGRRGEAFRTNWINLRVSSGGNRWLERYVLDDESHNWLMFFFAWLSVVVGAVRLYWAPAGLRSEERDLLRSDDVDDPYGDFGYEREFVDDLRRRMRCCCLAFCACCRSRRRAVGDDGDQLSMADEEREEIFGDRSALVGRRTGAADERREARVRSAADADDADVCDSVDSYDDDDDDDGYADKHHHRHRHHSNTDQTDTSHRHSGTDSKRHR